MRSHFLVLLLAASSLAVAPTALAAGKPGTPVILPTGPTSSPWTMVAVCSMGVSQVQAHSFGIFPPDDIFFTLLRRSSCTACAGSDQVLLSEASVRLFFPTVCRIPTKASIVGWLPSSCGIIPDAQNVICPDVSVVLEADDVGGRTFSIPLAADCRMTDSTFLKITFTEVPDSCIQGVPPSQSRPQMMQAGVCRPCESWGLESRGLIDVCDPVEGIGWQPIMFVVGDVCVTPVRPRSWGRIKTLYRN